MTYNCLKCGEDIEPDELRGNRIRCIYCGHRILTKKRGVGKKTVKAR